LLKRPGAIPDNLQRSSVSFWLRVAARVSTRT
jgi:hypothetical protein